jgi:hypothetical protein
MKEEKIITEKDYLGMIEVFDELYKCPYCNESVAVYYKYCSQCGKVLKFDLSRKLKYERFLNNPAAHRIKILCNRCTFYDDGCGYSYGKKHENNDKECPFFTKKEKKK